MTRHREALPLVPLLHAYAAGGLASPGALHQLAGIGPRFAAVLGASARFLYTEFLDRASEDAFRDALTRFYNAVVPLPLHSDTLQRRASFLRHAVSATLHGNAPPAEKFDAGVNVNGAYHVPGIGPAFWSALLQATCPARLAGWTTLACEGARRLGLVKGQGAIAYSSLLAAHSRIRGLRPDFSALHVDYFLSLVGVMPGRSPLEGAAELARCPIRPAIDRLRRVIPLRERLKTRGQAIADGQREMESGLRTQDGKLLGNALAAADPLGFSRCPLDWGAHGETLTLWLGRIWESDEPYTLLHTFWRADPLPGAGLWLPCAALHLRDPQSFAPYNDVLRQAHAQLDDGLCPADPPAERYRIFNEAAQWLRERFTLHPLEVPAVLATLGGEELQESQTTSRKSPECRFSGFCADSFAFLAELAKQNHRDWMQGQRHRYHFAVRDPLVELCRVLGERYVRPVLCGRHGWDIDTDPTSGHALTNICKNAFGRSLPYNSAMWITFCRKGANRAAAQLFVRLSSDGIRYGLRLGRSAQDDRAQLRAGIETHGESILRSLSENGALESCQFGLADVQESAQTISTLEKLRAWAYGRTQEASWSLVPTNTLATSDELAGEVLLAFDRLLPLFAACMQQEAIVPTSPNTADFGEGDFLRQTYLPSDWLTRTLQLLELKKQLILQGVPGTGKTHVARCLARLLAHNQPDAVRLVQFHPAYSYEEFVEGIRVKSIAVDGRHDVSYPVEDGLLCSFANRAAERPAQPHVLVIDEINRGNLPRIFGELLYLLEYRGQAVELPCSRRSFQLPPNLYLVATMNGADRSIAALDQALRRRFSFVEMEPDVSVLASWLRANPPNGGTPFMAHVLSVFERLNSRLQSEIGPQARVGHSYFMIAGLDEERLSMVWKHHIRPLVEDFFAGQPGRAAAYDGLFAKVTTRGRAETVKA